VPHPLSLNVVGLFAGVGAFERGLAQAGHTPLMLCEIDAGAVRILETRFPPIPIQRDVRKLRELPPDTELVVGGFPCQDLSQAGRTTGIDGANSGLVGEILRLLRKRPIPWVVMENVPFMLHLAGGRAISTITSALEKLGYNWAYRTVDSRSFGVPQRRRRVYLVASLGSDPCRVLFADNAGEKTPCRPEDRSACGFYWTEGNRGLGWAIDAVPPLKGSTTIGYPSPPAIILPSGDIVTPDIRDAERLQGLPMDWTRPAEEVVRRSLRWKLVGNAVTVPVARWIGRRIARPGDTVGCAASDWDPTLPWPTAAAYSGGRRQRLDASEWPVRSKYTSLLDFLKFPGVPLSYRATSGFHARVSKSSLRLPPGLIEALVSHRERMRHVRPMNRTAPKAC